MQSEPQELTHVVIHVPEELQHGIPKVISVFFMQAPMPDELLCQKVPVDNNAFIHIVVTIRPSKTTNCVEVQCQKCPCKNDRAPDFLLENKRIKCLATLWNICM